MLRELYNECIDEFIICLLQFRLSFLYSHLMSNILPIQIWVAYKCYEAQWLSLQLSGWFPGPSSPVSSHVDRSVNCVMVGIVDGHLSNQLFICALRSLRLARQIGVVYRFGG